MKNPKLISAYKLKNKNESGELCNTRIYIYDNGNVSIFRHFLDSRNDLKHHTKLCTKFGKTLYINTIAFKYTTLASIFSIVNRDLGKQKITKKLKV